MLCHENNLSCIYVGRVEKGYFTQEVCVVHAQASLCVGGVHRWGKYDCYY